MNLIEIMDKCMSLGIFHEVICGTAPFMLIIGGMFLGILLMLGSLYIFDKTKIHYSIFPAWICRIIDMFLPEDPAIKIY